MTTCWPIQATESSTFSYGGLLRPMLCARTVYGATVVFCGPREHPNIFQENRGINLILGNRNGAIWKTPLSVSMHGRTHSLVHRQSQCFNALLILKRMLMSENLHVILARGCCSMLQIDR